MKKLILIAALALMATPVAMARAAGKRAENPCLQGRRPGCGMTPIQKACHDPER